MNKKCSLTVISMLILITPWLLSFYQFNADVVNTYGNKETLSKVKKATIEKHGTNVIIKDYSPSNQAEQVIAVDEIYQNQIWNIWSQLGDGEVFVFREKEGKSIGNAGAEIYYTAKDKPVHVRLNIDANALNEIEGVIIDENSGIEKRYTQCIDASGEYLYLGKHNEYGLLNNPYYHQVSPVDSTDFSTRTDLMNRHDALFDENRRNTMGIKSVFTYNNQLSKDIIMVQSYMTRFATEDPIGKNFEASQYKTAMINSGVDINTGWANYAIPRYIEIKDTQGKTTSEFLFLSFFRADAVGHYKTYLVEGYPANFFITYGSQDITDSNLNIDLPYSTVPGTTTHKIALNINTGDDYSYSDIDRIEWVEFNNANITSTDNLPEAGEMKNLGDTLLPAKSFSLEIRGSSTGAKHTYGMRLHFKDGTAYPPGTSAKTVGDKYMIHWTGIQETAEASAAIESTTADHILDYDELTREFVQPLSPITASLSPPSNFDGWDGAASLSFHYSINGSHDLIEGAEAVAYTHTDLGRTSVTLSPVITWTTHRKSLGDNPPGGLYHANGMTAIKSFDISYGGTLSRDYHYSVTVGTGIHEHTETRHGTVTEAFDSGHKTIPLQAKVYNGIALSRQNLTAEEKETGSKQSKNLFWEGTPYEIRVQRYMRNVDKNQNTLGEIIGADGKQDRYFQHIDTAEIDYTVVKSLKQNFDADREMARDNIGGSIKGTQYINAPFATDKPLQKYDYPIKSGYFYKPNAKYTVKLKTVIYKWEGKETEHKDMAKEIIKSFYLQPQIPTVARDKKIMINLQGDVMIPGKYGKYGYPVKIDEKYKCTAKTAITYKPGPANLTEYFQSNDTVMGIGDKWLKKIIEGWTASSSITSWQTKQYREFVKDAKLYKIEEETELTFTVNPEQTAFYIIPQTQDGQYPIKAGFTGYGVPIKETSRRLSSKGSGEIDNIVFTILGSMYDDSSNY